MSNVKIAIAMSDGTVAVMSFITSGRGNALPHGGTWSDAPGHWERAPTDENIFQEISRTFISGAQPVSYRLLKDDEAPQDRSFRDAWVDRGSGIEHDMPKARNIHLDRLRRQRAVELEALDRDWMRANGQGSPAEAMQIEARRQRWRDMPVTVAGALTAAQTIDELKAVIFPGN
jgi:hypothetical protein